MEAPKIEFGSRGKLVLAESNGWQKEGRRRFKYQDQEVQASHHLTVHMATVSSNSHQVVVVYQPVESPMASKELWGRGSLIDDVNKLVTQVVEEYMEVEVAPHEWQQEVENKQMDLDLVRSLDLE